FARDVERVVAGDHCRARCTRAGGLLAAANFSQRRVSTDFRTGAEAGQPARVRRGVPIHTLPVAQCMFGGGGQCMSNVAVPLSSTASSWKAANASISLGLGLTNECNLSCAFCYRDPTRTDRLSLDQLKSIMERLPIHSVNLGTGENGMHPDFKKILAYLRQTQIKLTITSNGHSVAVLDDNELRAFHDIEFSLDYPTQVEQDAQRGNGNWELIHRQAKR